MSHELSAATSHDRVTDPERIRALGIAILYASLVPFLFQLFSAPHGDVRLYYEVTEDLSSGILPYRDRVFEYPPYALLWFLIPSLGQSLEHFQWLFALEILVLDVLVKCGLLLLGLEVASGLRALGPLVAYSAAAAFLNHFYLQRMDLIPAALGFGMLFAFWRSRYFLAGLLLALGIGTKLYPVLFGLPLLVMAFKQHRERQRADQASAASSLAADQNSRGGDPLQSPILPRLWRRDDFRLLLGCAAGIAPIGLLSFIVPWWRFLQFHAQRGLEVESLWASVLWLLHHVMELNLEWSWVTAWREVTGPEAQALLPWAKFVCVLAVGVSIIAVCFELWRRQGVNVGVSELAKSMLIPVLPFVAFNIVLSPQYMLWLLGLAAAASLSAKSRAVLLVPLAAVLTPVWYPSEEFRSGLTLFQTSVLLIRNLWLIGVWVALLLELLESMPSRWSANRESPPSSEPQPKRLLKENRGGAMNAEGVA